MKTRGVWYLLVLLLLSSSTVPAQSTQAGLAPVMPTASAAAYYYIARPGELTMQVNIWGAIRNSGRYEVPSSTDLVQLISYAGGPSADAVLDEVRIVRSAKEGVSGNAAHVVNLDDLANTDVSTLVLQPGDTIFIEHSNWSTVRDVMSVITTVAIVTTAIAYIIIAQE